ncbi:WG repeat-containing protein [Haloferula sp.]|uniref:WG repeat-containing protein n=1 Tax=Haloferula sp. TaxID=2497595 RepID=UPI003C79220A
MEDVSDDSDFRDWHIPYTAPAKYGLINTKGETLVEPTWDGVEILSPEWVKFRVGDKVGLVDQTGTVRVKAEWDQLRILTVNTATLAEDGKALSRWRGGRRFLSPWIEAKSGDETVILDSDGKRALPESLGDVKYVDFYGPDRVVFRREKPGGAVEWILFDPKSGKEVGFPNAKRLYWNWQSAERGLLMIGVGEGENLENLEWRLTNDSGQDLGHIIVGSYYGWDFDEGNILIHNEDGWRLIDPAGEQIGEGPWERYRPFAEGRAAVQKEALWSFIDSEGKVISPPRWKEVKSFKQGMAAVQNEDDGLWGFIDAEGKTVVDPEWNVVSDFKQGFAAVQREKDGLWGFVDTNGEVVVDSIWDAVSDFEDWRVMGPGKKEVRPLAQVALAGTWCLIDGDGNMVVDPIPNERRSSFGSVHERLSRTLDAPIGDFDPVAWNAARLNPITAWVAKHNDKDIVNDGTEIARNDGTPLKWGIRANEWWLVDDTGKVMTGPWGRPWYDSRGDEFADGALPIRTSEGEYGLVRIADSPPHDLRIIEPSLDRIAWVANGVAAAWSDSVKGGGGKAEGGLINARGDWVFQDNERVRVARFGTNSDKITPPRFRHGLVVTETPPKWGYARVNRAAAINEPSKQENHGN